MRNHKLKGVITDYDGVLVDSNFNYHMPNEVKNAINEIIHKDYVFSIATGRIYQGIIEKTCSELRLTDPQIVSGGAKIINPKTKNDLWVRYIANDVARKIINFLTEENFDVIIESNGDVFSLNRQKYIEYGPNINYKDLKKMKIDRIEKIRITKPQNPSAQKKLDILLKDNLSAINSIQFHTGNCLGFDLTSYEASKYNAALELIKIVKLKPNNFVGIGDGPNDLPLLRACGYKIALQNAPIELKNIADYVAPDFDNAGFINASEHILKL